MKAFYVGCRLCKEKFEVAFGPEARLIKCGCENVIVEVEGNVARVMEKRIGASVILTGEHQVQLTGSVRPQSVPCLTSPEK